MQFFDQLGKNLKHLLLGVFGFLMLLSILLGSALALVFSSITLLIYLVYSRSYHILNPILASKYGAVLLSNGYSLSYDNKVAVRAIDGKFKAISIAVLEISSKITNEGSKFEEILSKCKFPFELNIAIKGVELKKVVDSLETRRRIKEIEISKTEATKYQTISKLKRELNIVEGEIASLTSGKLPVETIVRLSSSSICETEGEAIGSVRNQVIQVCGIFSATYAVGYRLLAGEELLRELGG